MQSTSRHANELAFTVTVVKEFSHLILRGPHLIFIQGQRSGTKKKKKKETFNKKHSCSFKATSVQLQDS